MVNKTMQITSICSITSWTFFANKTLWKSLTEIEAKLSSCKLMINSTDQNTYSQIRTTLL